MRVRWSWIPLLSALALLAAGCAPKAVVLDPGPVPMPEGAKRVQGPAAWSLWVAEARDVRPEDRRGQRIGTLYTRFEKNPQSAFLAQDPDQYVKEQLARYLLHRGLEASGPQTARTHLVVDLEAFRIAETPGAVWDDVAVQVAYIVRFRDPSGQELGHVKVQGSADVKSPLETDKRVEQALREALADTFDALARSDVFQKILAR